MRILYDRFVCFLCLISWRNDVVMNVFIDFMVDEIRLYVDGWVPFIRLTFTCHPLLDNGSHLE